MSNLDQYKEEDQKQNAIELYESACIRVFSPQRKREQEEASSHNEGFSGQGRVENCFSWWAAGQGETRS